MFIDEPAVSEHLVDGILDDGFKIVGKPLARRRRVRYRSHGIRQERAFVVSPGKARAIWISLPVDLLAAFDEVDSRGLEEIVRRVFAR